ncbi:hypothetical protein C8R46DRAFT_1105341, partial [Mycena filopes]
MGTSLWVTLTLTFFHSSVAYGLFLPIFASITKTEITPSIPGAGISQTEWPHHHLAPHPSLKCVLARIHNFWNCGTEVQSKPTSLQLKSNHRCTGSVRVARGGHPS